MADLNESWREMEMDGMCVSLSVPLVCLCASLITLSLHLSLRHTTPHHFSLSLSLSLSRTVFCPTLTETSHGYYYLSIVLTTKSASHLFIIGCVRSLFRSEQGERGVSAALPASNAITAPQTEQETNMPALIRSIRGGDVCGVVWFHVYVRTVKTPPSLLRRQGMTVSASSQPNTQCD